MKRLKTLTLLIAFATLALPVKAEKTNKLTLGYELDIYKRASDYGPWHLAYLDYSHRFPFMTFIGRFNFANRSFGGAPRNGVQFELDAWPKITEGVYGYLNLGYSPSAIFPLIRAGAEPYFKLPWSMETSLGIRYLRFVSSTTDSVSNVFIFTGHLGKYYKDYWFSIRPFVTFKPAGVSLSGIFLARRYFKDADNYLGVMLGYGSSPEELATPDQIARAASYKAGLELVKAVTPAFLIKPGLKYEYEEYRIGEFGHHLTFSLSLAARF